MATTTNKTGKPIKPVSGNNKPDGIKPGTKKGNPTKKNKSKELFDALIYAAVVAFFIKVFFFEAYRIPTGSMENTLLIGDFLIVTKFTYGSTTPRNVPFTDIRLPFIKLPGFKDPEPGDVVVFDYPGNQNELESPVVMNYIKRCVGGPGDTIQVINKVLYLNSQEFPKPPDMILRGQSSPEGQSEVGIYPMGTDWNKDNYGPLAIPKEGDVIQVTPESYNNQWKMFIQREGHETRLDGESIVVDGTPLPNNQYTVERDYYFMMGDNRDNSSDSRYWGYVSDDDIVGEALVIYWSWDANIPFSRFGDLIGSIRWSRIGKAIN